MNSNSSFESNVRQLSFFLLDGKKQESIRLAKYLAQKSNPLNYAESQFNVLKDMDLSVLSNDSSLFFNLLGMICERYLCRIKIQK